jgi:hypothetical protein
MQGSEITYQWCKDGEDIAGVHAKQATFVIDGPAVSDSGRYRLVVSNAVGCAKSIEALVHVRLPAEQHDPPGVQPALADLGPHGLRRTRSRRLRTERQLSIAQRESRASSAAMGQGLNIANVNAASAAVLQSDPAHAVALSLKIDSGPGNHAADAVQHDGTDREISDVKQIP